MVNPLNLAEYILYNSHCEINNLRLNKHIYLITLDFYNRCREWLVNGDFHVHQYGPIIQEVYYYYRSYGSRSIDVDKVVELIGVNDNEKYEIDISIDIYNDKRSYEIIEMVHRRNGAWSRSEYEGLTVIPRDYVIAEALSYGR